ncbi:MAG: hypothetical protein CMJ59_11240 [Planctomycetaceae bacterium]|nr:hypothetical protein [Planctomycetaceae bacterium]
MKGCWVAVFGCVGLLAPQSGAAHQLQPAYLELREVTPGNFAVAWRTPRRAERPALWPRLPEGSHQRGPIGVQQQQDISVYRWLIQVPAGTLRGSSIEFPGRTAELMDIVVRIVWRQGPAWTGVVRGSQEDLRIPRQPTPGTTLTRYVALGVEHIWFGFDHLLFVLGLLWIARGWKRLVATVTAFTLAHSLTLSLAVTSAIRLPPVPVEAVIALSILLLAGEVSGNAQGATSRYVWAVGFGFGLLHGFGFAGALGEVGLPPGAMLWALAGFNLGVELGQLVFVLVLMLAGLLWSRRAAPSGGWIERLPVYGMGTVAAFWFFQRLAAFP